jgi:hypothetical protein
MEFDWNQNNMMWIRKFQWHFVIRLNDF